MVIVICYLFIEMWSLCIKKWLLVYYCFPLVVDVIHFPYEVWKKDKLLHGIICFDRYSSQVRDALTQDILYKTCLDRNGCYRQLQS